MTIAELIEQARQLAHRGARLQETTTRRSLVTEESAAEIEELKADPSTSGRAYRLLGKAQHQADAKKIAEEKARILGPRLNLHFYEAEHLRMQIERALGDFVKEAQQPPAIGEAFRRLIRQVGISADQIIALAGVEQLTIANLRAAVPTMRPSERLDLYRRALTTPNDPTSAVTIRFMEETNPGYTGGETSPLPESEMTAAATLGRLKQETRASRIPEEVAEVEKVLSDVAAIIKTAQRSGAVPLNPDHQPAVAQEIAEQEEQEAQEAEA